MKNAKKVKSANISATKPNNSALTNLAIYLHNYIDSLNNSKLFAGLMIIILNIASRFVTVKLSKSMEAYLKYTFSRQILIFAIAWMGTRDIYVAIVITLVFMIFMDFLFNEDSRFCCLPAEFTEYHHKLHDDHKNDPPASNPSLPPGSAAKPVSLTDNQASTSTSTSTSSQQVKDAPITEEQIQQAKAILDRAKQQNSLQYQPFYKSM